MQTQKYDVLLDVAINNKVHRKGGTVDLTERQARYLLLAKKIEPSLVVSHSHLEPFTGAPHQRSDSKKKPVNKGVK